MTLDQEKVLLFLLLKFFAGQQLSFAGPQPVIAAAQAAIATQQMVFAEQQLAIAGEQMAFAGKQMVVAEAQPVIATAQAAIAVAQIALAGQQMAFAEKQMLLARGDNLFVMLKIGVVSWLNYSSIATITWSYNFPNTPFIIFRCVVQLRGQILPQYCLFGYLFSTAFIISFNTASAIIFMILHKKGILFY